MSCRRLLNTFPNLQIHTRCRDSVYGLPILINGEGLGSLWWQNGQDRLGAKFGRKAVCRIAFRCARQRRFRPMDVSGWSWFVSRTIENRHTGKDLSLTFEFQFRDRLSRLGFENQIEVSFRQLQQNLFLFLFLFLFHLWNIFQGCLWVQIVSSIECLTKGSGIINKSSLCLESLMRVSIFSSFVS